MRRIIKVQNQQKLPAMKKITIKRVAVYARVSTDRLEQQSSFEAQKDYYVKEIENHKDWILAGIYADDGISGTSFLKREEFKRMIDDCRNGKIDMILTKSISRFARNTVDALNTIRELSSMKIGVYFQKENIWTLDSKGEFLITLMSSLAQEESRSLSENVSWGHHKRFSDGKYSVAYSRFLGYDFGFKVNKEQAVVIRRIFKLFLQGYSLLRIAEILTEEKISPPAGGERWGHSTIRSMIHNEKYKGDALSQKTFTVDFLTKKHKKNNGELPKYYVEGGHEAIIDPELFDYVQEKNLERSCTENRYSGLTIYSCRIICGICGRFYGRRVVHSNNKYRKAILMCSNRYKTGCKNMCITEEKMAAIYSEIAKKYIAEHPQVLKICRQVAKESEVEQILPLLESPVIDKFDLELLDDLSLVIRDVTVYPDGKLVINLIDGDKQETTVEQSKNKVYKNPLVKVLKSPCKQCGILIEQEPNNEKKLFCSDACRKMWQTAHDVIPQKKEVLIKCQYCGKTVYQNYSERKYCSRACYHKARACKDVKSKG